MYKCGLTGHSGILGSEIKKGVISNGENIDINNFTNGLYFLKLDKGSTIKFIKK